MSHGRIEPAGSTEHPEMTETPPPGKDASVEDIEADIAATRERLAESVDALADKVNVKARAQEKVREKLDEARTKGQDLLSQAWEASRPVQLAIVSVPVAVIVLIVRAVRGRRS